MDKINTTTSGQNALFCSETLFFVVIHGQLPRHRHCPWRPIMTWFRFWEALTSPQGRCGLVLTLPRWFLTTFFSSLWRTFLKHFWRISNASLHFVENAADRPTSPPRALLVADMYDQISVLRGFGKSVSTLETCSDLPWTIWDNLFSSFRCTFLSRFSSESAQLSSQMSDRRALKNFRGHM